MKESHTILAAILVSTAWLTAVPFYARQQPPATPVVVAAPPVATPSPVEAEQPPVAPPAVAEPHPPATKKWAAKPQPEGTTKDELQRRIDAFDAKVAATHK